MRVPEYKEQYRYTTSHGGGRIQGVHGGQNADTQSLLMAGKSMQGLGDSLMKAIRFTKQRIMLQRLKLKSRQTNFPMHLWQSKQNLKN